VALGIAIAWLWLVPPHLQANNHDLHIQELMAGANGDARIQFIVIRQHESGENLWGPQGNETQARAMLVFFDAVGRETGKFKFPANPPTRGSLQVLIATSEFARQSGAPQPDIIIPPLLISIGGQVCFRNNPENASATVKNECVSYGNFAGEIEVNRSGEADGGVGAGPPAPRLPITDTVSLQRIGNTGQNSNFTVATTPTPVNFAGSTFTIAVAPTIVQGENLFNFETFAGNGRTCASCHIANESFMLSPGNVQMRFAALGAPTPSFDPLFVGESAPAAFDAGFDFNLNTLTLTSEVATPVPCTGELRGQISTPNGGRGKVLTRLGATTYLVYGGLNPPLEGVVTDGACAAPVAGIRAGNLATDLSASLSGIEDPRQMRDRTDMNFPDGRALILENVDGFANPPVFRKSPHLLNLAGSAPYGLSGEFADLATFSTGAVTQHFPRTLARQSDGPNPDFRMPTGDELEALTAFMLAQQFPAGDDPNKYDLARFATTETQRRGQEEFFNFGCASCHGGPTLNQTTVSIQGKAVGVNAAFNIGTASGNFGRSLPCEPGTEIIGTCGSREFSTPQLFNLPNLGPYFHNGSVRTLAEAVNFYQSSEFGRSPAGVALVFEGVGLIPTDAITQFLSSLVDRPYVFGDGPVRFGAHDPGAGVTELQSVTVTNTSITPLDFDANPCRLEGSDPGEFTIASCPLTARLAAGETRTVVIAFDPTTDGSKSAILEIHPAGSAGSGLELFGVGGELGPPPRLSQVTPISGAALGGVGLTFVGEGFLGGAEVRVGDLRTGFVNVLSSTTVVAWTGNHEPGAVDVVIVNPDGQTVVLENAFTFVGPEEP